MKQGAKTKGAGGAALLIVDMINDLRHEGSKSLRDNALPAADRIADLSGAVRKAGVPVIYVNDNFGQWHSERARLIEHCLRPESNGQDIVRRVMPVEGDYFVTKPQFSGFYATSLPVLLPQLGASRIILTGIAADMCVLFTAADAHMRDYELWVPQDCVASSRADHAEWALEIMRKSMHAEVRPTSELSLADWLACDAEANS